MPITPRRLTGGRPSRAAALLLLSAIALSPAGCSSRRSVVLDMSGAIMYEKPAILTVQHIVVDERSRGGAVSVEVELQGDQGLAASFDITPGIVERAAMSEVAAGRYSARFEMPAGTVGGPFTVLGRLQHPQAGEVVSRDPVPITIPLPDSGF